MSEGWPELVTRAVEQHVMERARLEEEYCERMLVDPEQRGVLITEGSPILFSIELSPSVPWGQIHIRKLY